jgi:hypothetical protein
MEVRFTVPIYLVSDCVRLFQKHKRIACVFRSKGWVYVFVERRCEQTPEIYRFGNLRTPVGDTTSGLIFFIVNLLKSWANPAPSVLLTKQLFLLPHASQVVIAHCVPRFVFFKVTSPFFVLLLHFKQ